MRLEEIIDLLAVDWEEDEPAFYDENKIEFPDALLSSCGSLVTTHIEKTGMNHLGEVVEQVGTLTTSHNTVREYLTLQPLKVGDQAEVKLDKAEVNLQMALTCLGYLRTLFNCGEELTEELLKTYPCARHCAQYWDDYYREAIKSPDHALDMSKANQMVIGMMDDSASLLKMVSLCDPDADDARVNTEFDAGAVSTPL